MYPLVNSHITMENHQFSWVNQQNKWQFSSSQTVSLPEGTQPTAAGVSPKHGFNQKITWGLKRTSNQNEIPMGI